LQVTPGHLHAFKTCLFPCLFQYRSASVGSLVIAALKSSKLSPSSNKLWVSTTPPVGSLLFPVAKALLKTTPSLLLLLLLLLPTLLIATLPQSPPGQKLEEEEAPDNKHQLPKSNTNVTTEIWLQFSKTRNSLAMEPPTTTILSSSVSFLSAAVLLFLGILMNSRWAFFKAY
jgi:hypothetical protein